MDRKELKRLSRGDLLKILLAQIEENERLQEELDIANDIIKKREITIRKAGSIADASLALNDIFTACDRAAQDYLVNIIRTADDRRKAIISDAKIEAQRIIDQAKECCKESNSTNN